MCLLVFCIHAVGAANKIHHLLMVTPSQHCVLSSGRYFIVVLVSVLQNQQSGATAAQLIMVDTSRGGWR